MTSRDARLLAMLLALPLVVPHGAAAQAVCTTGKIAVVQTHAIFASIDRYTERDTAMTVYQNIYNVGVSRLQSIMDSVVRAYREKSALLPASARVFEVKKLDDQNTLTQQRVRDLQQELAQKRERLLQPIEMGVQAVLDSIRTELRCAMIFDVSSALGIASVNKSLDLTQRVIDRIKTTGDTALFGPHAVVTARP